MAGRKYLDKTGLRVVPREMEFHLRDLARRMEHVIYYTSPSKRAYDTNLFEKAKLSTSYNRWMLLQRRTRAVTLRKSKVNRVFADDRVQLRVLMWLQHACTCAGCERGACGVGRDIYKHLLFCRGVCRLSLCCWAKTYVAHYVSCQGACAGCAYVKQGEEELKRRLDEFIFGE
jgi:hypothetical protein